MSLDYHTYFPAVNLPRLELLDLLGPILVSSGMSFSGECMELARTEQGSRYAFTYRERQFDCVREAILATREWDGVMLEYDAPFGDRSVFLWKNEHGAGEVFGFDDTSAHFLELTLDEERWRGFEDFIMDLAAATGSSYALTVADPVYATLTESDVNSILDQLPHDPLRARPPLIVLGGEFKVGDRAGQVIETHYSMRDVKDYIVYREKHYGMGPP